jgi:hypothetical protein
MKEGMYLFREQFCMCKVSLLVTIPPNKTDRQDKAKILLKVALNTITLLVDLC